MNSSLRLTALAIALSLPLIACGGGTSNGPASTSAARELLERVVLLAAEVGPGYTQTRAAVHTNGDLAAARPDTDNAAAQYAAWGQLLEYNVQHSAPREADLFFNGEFARVMNTATLFATTDGADAALAYTRELSASTVANFLVNDGPGARVSETQVVKDIDFPPTGDGSFAWRLSGKATFQDGLTTTFVADAVFVRAGRVNGNVTALAFGQAPKRDALVTLVDTFVARARANP